MPILNRGKKGLRVEGQPLVLGPGSYINPAAAGPFVFEDFLNLTIVTASNVGAGANVVINSSNDDTTPATINATAGAPVAGHGGWISGATDNVDNEIDEVALGRAGWMVPSALDSGGILIAEAGFVLPALTTRINYFGFTDIVTNAAADGAISIATGVTLVSGATGDAAGFVNSSLATDNDAWYTGSVLATSVGTAYNTTAGTDGAAELTPTADDYTRLRVELDSAGNAYFFSGISTTLARDAIPLTFRHAVATAVTPTVAFLPIYSTATTTTTSIVWEIDYMFGAATNA